MIKIPVSAELNQQDVNRQISQMEDALNELGRVAQEAGKVRFTPVSKTSIEDVSRIRKEFEAMTRMAPGLKRALEAGGQGGKTFDQVDWGKVWEDPNRRSAHAASMLRRLQPSSAEITTPPRNTPSEPTPSGAGSGRSGGGGRGPRGGHPEGGGGQPSWRRAAAGGLAGAAGGVASQIGGIAGGVASGALAGGLAGGPIGAAVGGLFGALTSLLGSIGEARDIAISIDTLKRTLGDTNVSFDGLNEKTRGLADEFSLTDAESSALTKRYANLAGSGKDTGALRDEVGVGVGFSRSFGLDPSAGVNFFGQMRGMGITRNSDDNKRLALLIGESVAKAGDLPRMGDVLAGLSRYIESASRTSLTAPNSAAWLSRFAGLERSGLAGMDPTTASSIIGNIDNAIRQGGVTEAGRNFMNGVLQRDQNLNTIQAAIQLEGGAFGSGRSTFGADSAMSRFYSRFGGGSPLSSWNSDESNISVLQRNLISQYKGKPPELMLDAFKNTFGTSYGQAAAWMSTDPEQNNNMLKRMQRLGINWKDVNATGVSQISQIEADGSLSEDQKDEMIRQASTKNQEDTVGSEARRASIDGANAMVRLATEGLPMISSIQAGVLKLAGLDPLAGEKARVQDQHDKNLAAIRGKEGKALDDAQAEYERVTPMWKRASGIGLSDEQQLAKDRRDSAQQDYDSAVMNERKRWKGDLDQIGQPVTPQSAAAGKTPGTSTAASSAAAKRQLELDAQHQAALGKIKAEQGKVLAEAAAEAFKVMSPEQLNGKGAPLSEDQQFVKDRYDAAKDDYDSSVAEEQARWKGERDKLEPTASTTNVPGGASGVTPALLARAAESDRKAGLAEGTTAALIMQESRFKTEAVSSAGAQGPFQMMPENTREFSRRAGRQLDPTKWEDGFHMYDEMMRELKAYHKGDNEKMLRSYHGGYDKRRWGKVNADYVPAIERRKREMEAAGQTAQQMQHNVGVEVVLRDQAGNRREDASITTTVGKPTASGAR